MTTKRYAPDELRTTADRAEVNGMPEYASMLRQAADDYERIETMRVGVRNHRGEVLSSELFISAIDEVIAEARTQEQAK